jgi:ABC-type uncharacterized transport system substrate-binding protein
MTAMQKMFLPTSAAETGYIEQKNVSIEYRWALNQNDRLAALATELVRRQVSLIVVLESTNGALAAKAATQTIPIIFMQGADPVQIGLVDSLNRPGGNATGNAARIGACGQINRLPLQSDYPVYAETESKEVRAAASELDVRLLIENASRASEIETAFEDLVRQRADAILVSSDGFFLTHPAQIVALAAQHAVPAIYGWRQAMAAGGLMSYGTNIIDAWRQAGVYAGRVLKGERPAELPVQQVTKVELIINLKVAKALGLTFPMSLLGRADEVIE